MSSDESERRVAEALRARATGAGARASGRPGARTAHGGPRSSASEIGLQTVLTIALLGGIALGVLLGVLSLLFPGLLPPLG